MGKQQTCGTSMNGSLAANGSKRVTILYFMSLHQYKNNNKSMQNVCKEVDESKVVSVKNGILRKEVKNNKQQRKTKTKTTKMI